MATTTALIILGISVVITIINIYIIYTSIGIINGKQNKSKKNT